VSEARVEHARTVLRALASEDPTPVHFKMARKIAKDNGWNWKYNALGDHFARAMCDACNKLADGFNFDECDGPGVEIGDYGYDHPALAADVRLVRLISDIAWKPGNDGEYGRQPRADLERWTAWESSAKTEADEESLWALWAIGDDGAPRFLEQFAASLWRCKFWPEFRENELHWRKTTEAFETVLGFVAKHFSINVDVTCNGGE